MTNIAPGSQNLPFDRGIDSISYVGVQTPTALPERTASAPAELGSRPHLSVLLDRPSLDDLVSESIRPSMLNRDLLMPVKFRQALDGALQHLKNAAIRIPESGQQESGGDDRLRVLNRATRLLNEEVNLRDLVQMYRSALYQG